MSGMTPFRIDVPQEVLDDLRARLDRTRWPDQIADSGWDYGTDSAYLRELCDHWRTLYDWRAWETRINAFPQFTTTIDGASIHFLHVRSPESNALPLVLSHGWPGSFVEFLEVIGPLSDPRAHGGDPADAFHVVVPSLPGYGFSGPTTDRGWDVARIGRAFATLMSELGYPRYGAQGGDWGSMVSRTLGVHDAQHVVGVHLNMLIALPSGDPDEMASLTDDEKARLASAAAYQKDGAGYLKIQATRPQTIAYALNDSPAGLLAWIAEKFREWSDCAGEPDTAIDRDVLLTNTMIYWVTQTAGSSARLYYETGKTLAFSFEPSTTPTGVAVFPKEIFRPIRRFAERTNNIVHWSEHVRGGHFPAMEEPQLLVDDIRTFFRGLRS